MAGLRLCGQLFLVLWLLLRVAVAFHAGLRQHVNRRIHYRSFDVPLGLGWIALLLTHFVVTLFYVPSRSMQPTLEVHDGIAVNRLAYRFRRPEVDDIVVFALPPGRPAGGYDLVKRVVARGGDTVRLEQGVLYRNDQARPGVGPPVAGQNFPSRQVSTGSLFVMGDNRSNSVDSRVFGEISEDWLYGPVVWRYWPVTKWGRVR